MKNLNFLRHKPIWHTIEFYEDRMSIFFILSLLCPRTYGRGNKHCFCQSVCPSVAYIANNSRTQRPSVPKFGRKVPHLDATHIPVSRSNGQRSGQSGTYRVGRTRRPHCLFYVALHYLSEPCCLWHSDLEASPWVTRDIWKSSRQFRDS